MVYHIICSILISNPLKEKNGSVLLVTSVQNDDFRLVNVGSAATVNLKNGVQVNLKAHWWILEIWAPKQFKNSIEGLCGNYNGDRSDDFISRDGQKYNSATTAFKESWILDGTNCDRNDPEIPKCNSQKIARECGKLLGWALKVSNLVVKFLYFHHFTLGFKDRFKLGKSRLSFKP